MRYLILVSLLLSGCLHTPVKPPIISPPQETSAPSVDRRLLTPCGEPSLLDDPVTLEKVLMAHSADVAVITDCKNRHSGLVEVVKKSFDIK